MARKECINTVLAIAPAQDYGSENDEANTQYLRISQRRGLHEPGSLFNEEGGRTKNFI